MLKIGLIRESDASGDSRVPLTPQQCLELQTQNVKVVVAPSPVRCFTNDEYVQTGTELKEDLSDCDVLFGVKEVEPQRLIPGKTYFFFSHTKKKQVHNQALMHALIEKKITMVDYEVLTYENGQRIIGFGYFAGVVGAHNGLLTYGKKYDLFSLKPAYQCEHMNMMLQQYKNLELPPVRIVITGSGRVASGLIYIMHQLRIDEVSPDDFLNENYCYPVFTVLKGADLYQNRTTGEYDRVEFHLHPEKYSCKFLPYTEVADILLNGIYWDNKIDRLFEKEDVKNESFKLNVIADVTCDINGSVPINVGISTIENPVYGIAKNKLEKVGPYQNSKEVIDVMAVSNLPNELPRDASQYFGEEIIKYVIPELQMAKSEVLDRATICKDGKLASHFEYLSDYAY